MQTRSDQYAAYNYLKRRVLTSMTGDSPDSPEQPLKRLIIGTFAGILVMLVSGVVVGLVAYAGVGGNENWYVIGEGAGGGAGGKVIRDKNSAAQFVLMAGDPGKPPVLREVENFPSAQLVLGNPAPDIVSLGQDAIVTASKKGKIQRGSKVGIAGIPNTLPGKESLQQSDGGYRAAVCSRDDEKHQVDVMIPSTKTFPGARPSGGRPLFVQTSDGSRRYMVYRGKKLPIDPNGARVLGYNEALITVGTNWLNALPDGQRAEGPVVEGRGGKATYDVEGDIALGQVFRESGTTNYFVADKERLRGISEVEAKLLTGLGRAQFVDGRRQNIGDIKQVDTSVLNDLDKDALRPNDLPRTIPSQLTVRNPERTKVCAWFTDPKNDPGNTTFTVEGQLPPPTEASRAARGGAPNVSVLADNVIVPAGSGAVVAGSMPNSKAKTYFVIADDGRKYSMFVGKVGDQDVNTVDMLGYNNMLKSLPVMSPELLGLIPSGPGLAPEKAGAPPAKEAAGAGGGAGGVPGQGGN